MKKCMSSGALCDYRGEQNACTLERYCSAQVSMTNANRIRNMTDEELAEFIRSIETARCYIIINGFEIYNSDSNNLEEWLQSEVEK